jgi:serine/threonine protein kinase
MSQPRRSANQPDPDVLLDRFDEAWQNGTPPRIEEFVAQLGGSAASRQFLEDLVTIDLEYRWRQPPAGGAGLRPRFEDYVKQFPQLGRLEDLSCQLIGAEYRVRRRWGDKPEHAEYLKRFPHQGGKLQQTLNEIDVDLADENKGGAIAPRGSTSSTAVPEGAGETRATLSVATLIETLRAGQFLDQEALAELTRHLQARFREPRSLAKELLQRNWLTPYQVNQLLFGRGTELLLGPYLILERLGEGGAGLVFKARHQKLQRIVALKVLRKELLSDPDVLGRFYREIQIVSRLDHPNIVHAYDAGPITPVASPSAPGSPSGHFLAMEYVEGTDLGRLIKQGGPLPVEQACAYIRQAALGLQHAHEAGLVHRDIKPHNLILSLREGLVKVADLGLARLPRAANTEATAVVSGIRGTGTLTPEEAVMLGTADYMAPQQALDFHSADIRADIYSLGCTFYFLLTGQAPFAGGTMAQKLIKHQQADPPPLEHFRPDVPRKVAAALRKMLTKSPERRYQTPAEVAAALEPFCQVGDQSRQGHVRASFWRRRPVVVAGLILVLSALLFFLMRAKPEPSAAALAVLRGQYADTKIERDRVRQGILQLRMDFPGSKEALQAAELMMQLSSPLDRFDPEQIPAALRLDKPPKELVAVFGKKSSAGLRCIAISPDSRWVAAGTGDGMVQVWDLATGKERPTLAGHQKEVLAVAFSPDGKTLASAGEDKTVRLWDVNRSTEIGTLQGHQQTVRALAFSPDGNTLAAGDRRVRLWDMRTHKAELPHWEEFGSFIFFLVYSPDGRQLAVGSYEHDVKLIDVKKGDVTDRISRGPYALAFAPDGTTLALNSGTVQLRGPDKKLTPLPQGWFPGGPHHLAMSLDGQMLVAANLNVVVRWVAPFSSEPARCTLPPVMNGIAMAPDGRHLATANQDGTVYIFRLASAVKSR